MAGHVAPLCIRLLLFYLVLLILPVLPVLLVLLPLPLARLLSEAASSPALPTDPSAFLCYPIQITCLSKPFCRCPASSRSTPAMRRSCSRCAFRPQRPLQHQWVDPTPRQPTPFAHPPSAGACGKVSTGGPAARQRGGGRAGRHQHRRRACAVAAAVSVPTSISGPPLRFCGAHYMVFSAFFLR